MPSDLRYQVPRAIADADHLLSCAGAGVKANIAPDQLRTDVIALAREVARLREIIELDAEMDADETVY